jgi:2-keto-4-pentenoate hydratase
MTAFTDDTRIRKGMTAQLATRKQRMAAGEEPLGWKLGFGAPAAQARLGIARPLVGYLMKGALLPSGATVNVKGWVQPVAEPEIAVRLGRTIAAGATPATARAAIASLEPAIELADFDPVPTVDNIEAVLAGDIYQRHVVLDGQQREGGDTGGLSSRVTRRGSLAAETADPQALTGQIPDLLVHLADVLATFGEKASAGDVVICGSVVPPPLIEPDETEFAYRLDPIGAVSVRFTRE